MAEAVESLRAQTLGDWELLIIDDGSTDETSERAHATAARDNRIRVLRRPHEGLVPALNAGLAGARGEFVARMDADDVAHPERLAEQVRYLDAHPDIGLVSCLVEFGGDVAAKAGYALHVEWINSLATPDEIALNRFVESPLAHPSVMFRRTLIDQLGGYRDGDFPEDYELWLRWLGAGVRMAKVPRTLLRWNDPPGRLSRTHPRYSPDKFFELKATWIARELALRGAAVSPRSALDVARGLTVPPTTAELAASGGTQPSVHPKLAVAGAVPQPRDHQPATPNTGIPSAPKPDSRAGIAPQTDVPEPAARTDTLPHTGIADLAPGGDRVAPAIVRELSAQFAGVPVSSSAELDARGAGVAPSSTAGINAEAAPRQRGVWIWGAGRPTRKRAAYLSTHGIVIAGYIDIDPKKTGRSIAGIPVISPDHIPPPSKAYVLAYVSSRGARSLIRSQLRSRGYLEGPDFLVCA